MRPNSRRKWIAAIYLLIPSVNLQMAMYPMFPPPPMQVAVPMPMPFPVFIREAPANVIARKTTTTTTTTTERSYDRDRDHDTDRGRHPDGMSFPFPMPLPMPPGAFGVPIPPLMAPPPPVVVVPFPPPRHRRPKISKEDNDDCDFAEPESFSSECDPRRKRKKNIGRMNRRPYRTSFRSMEIVDNELVKPMLTYVSRDGDIKLKRRLTNDEAAELMNDKPFQKIDVLAGPDGDNKPRVLITTRNEKNQERTRRNHRRRQVVMTTGTAKQILGEGRKELVFVPPGGKQISNLSVSFQISGDS